MQFEDRIATIQRATQAGMEHHEAGQLAEAESAYRQVLQLDPNNAVALHLLGIVAHQSGDNALALQLIDRAVAAKADFALAFNSRGNVMQLLGRFEESLASYDRAVSIRPDYAEAWCHRGNVLKVLRRCEEALASCDRALALRPGFAEALSNRGNALKELGRHEEAIASYDSALAIEPGFAEALSNRGNALQEVGRYGDALASYDSALAIRPGFASALSNRANALINLKRYEDALASCDRALALRPGFAEALSNRGNALKELRRLDEAVASYDDALAVSPDFAEALSNRGNALKELKRYDEALASYDKALAIRPDFAEAWNNRGNALNELNRHAEALPSLDRALAIMPRYAEALSNRGNALRELERYEEAIACYDGALAIKPGFAEALNNRGNALTELGRHEEAIESYDSALAIEPDFAEALSNRGNVLGQLRRTEAAVASWHGALKLRTDHVQARCNWVHGRQQLCDWAGLEKEGDTLRGQVNRNKSGKVLPFQFLALPGIHASEHLLCARQYADDAFGMFLSRPPLCGALRRGADARKLRVGYLSSDLREHPVSYLLADVIESHDRDSFEIFGYSWGPDDASPMHVRMRTAFDAFLDITSLPNSAAATRIVEDRIDILVDLNGYTLNNRMSIVALRPAPLQVNWLGYPGTLGHPRLADYLIGDPVVTPLEHAVHYSESLALMPHCYLPSDRQRRIGKKPTRDEAGLPHAGFVFCCFNQAYKITSGMFDVWCKLLTQVPGSLLWLRQSSDVAQSNLRREAASRGVAAERLVFAAAQPLVEDHLARIQVADLALDTYPYTSHATGSDALWAGTPLITMAGESFASRVAASMLRAAGLPHLVAQDPESYFQVALELAKQPDRLRKVREDLWARRMSCSLFDSKRFTRNLERMYRTMWSDYCAGRKEHFLVEE